MRFTRAVLIGLGIGAVVVGPACGDDDAERDVSATGGRTTAVPATDDPSDPSDPADPGSDDPSSVTPDALDGREFVVVDVEGIELVKGSTIRMSFDGTKLGVAPGCNQFGGTYRLDEGKLVVGDLAGTEMGCTPQALMRQDVTIVDVLTASPHVALVGDDLTVAGPKVSLTLRDREVVEPDRPLVGTTWKVDTLNDGETASSLPQGVEATLRIDRKQGRLLVEAGCNSGSATVEIGDGELVIGDLVLTRMACAPEAMDVERHVVSVLSGKTVTVEVDADRLTLDAGDAGLGARAGR